MPVTLFRQRLYPGNLVERFSRRNDNIVNPTEYFADIVDNGDNAAFQYYLAVFCILLFLFFLF